MPKKPAKAKALVINSLFDYVEATTAGLVPELKSDPSVVENTIKTFEKSVALLKRFDPESRIEAGKRIAKAMNAISSSVNVAVFRKEKPDTITEDLFSEAKPEAPTIDLLGSGLF